MGFILAVSGVLFAQSELINPYINHSNTLTITHQLKNTILLLFPLPSSFSNSKSYTA